MADPRRSPYVWVTWLSKLMDDDQVPRCQWAAWFQAHHYYNKLDIFPPDQLRAWKKKHDEMVEHQVGELQRKGYRVFREYENDFKILFPSGAILAGRPDIVAVKGETALIMDCKTGVKLDIHQYQLLIYMYFLPHAGKFFSNFPMSGALCYQDGIVDVLRDRLDASFERRVRSLLATIVGLAEPDRQPHPLTCRFCNIPRTECPDRNDALGTTPVPFDKWDL